MEYLKTTLIWITRRLCRCFAVAEYQTVFIQATASGHQAVFIQVMTFAVVFLTDNQTRNSSINTSRVPEADEITASVQFTCTHCPRGNQSINHSISLIATLRPESRIANDMQLK